MMTKAEFKVCFDMIRENRSFAVVQTAKMPNGYIHLIAQKHNTNKDMYVLKWVSDVTLRKMQQEIMSDELPF